MPMQVRGGLLTYLRSQRHVELARKVDVQRRVGELQLFADFQDLMRYVRQRAAKLNQLLVCRRLIVVSVVARVQTLDDTQNDSRMLLNL